MILPEDAKTCLVVDDEPRLRAVLVRLLRNEGFACREAGSGVEALQELEREQTALVISDIRMPAMDGVTLLGEIVRRWPGIGVIVVTAVAEVESAVDCLKRGALDYVAKPFQLEEVRARIYQALDKRRLKGLERSYKEHLEMQVREQATRIGELFLEGVEALAHALEAKDKYLRGHSARVCEYAVRTARRLGLAEREIHILAYGAQLHDIGKIGVSEAVLHKPDRLTKEEYAHIMEHPEIGSRILAPFLKDYPIALAIVRSHHEKLDGSGLPDQLKGDQIPLEVRITTVADSLDAMLSARPYRSGLPVERALGELRTWSGVQFDAAVVDAFLAEFPAAELPIDTPTDFTLRGEVRETSRA